MVTVITHGILGVMNVMTVLIIFKPKGINGIAVWIHSDDAQYMNDY